jgi:hypothetical protein
MNVELEITLRCNARCPQCSRHCNIFDYGPSDMTLDQIHRFIAQVKEHGEPLDILSLMGGEPTIHPDFEKIVLLLFDELYVKGMVRRLRIATNGRRPIPSSIRERPIGIITSPVSKKDHRCQFIAPVDSGQQVRECPVPHVCGIALNYFGYFPCGAGGAIIRLFRLSHLIRHELPRTVEDFRYFHAVCGLCQASAVDPFMLRDHDPTPSLSFRAAIAAYEEEGPRYRAF